MSSRMLSQALTETTKRSLPHSRQVICHYCPWPAKFLCLSAGSMEGYTLDHAVKGRNAETLHLRRRSTEVFPPWEHDSRLCGDKSGRAKERNSDSTCLKTGAGMVHLNNRLSHNKQACHKSQRYFKANLIMYYYYHSQLSLRQCLFALVGKLSSVGKHAIFHTLETQHNALMASKQLICSYLIVKHLAFPMSSVSEPSQRSK